MRDNAKNLIERHMTYDGPYQRRNIFGWMALINRGYSVTRNALNALVAEGKMHRDPGVDSYVFYKGVEKPVQHATEVDGVRLDHPVIPEGTTHAGLTQVI